MGRYTNLYIGSHSHDWKGLFPEFMGRLFEVDDYIMVKSRDDDEEWTEHKFHSTCGQVSSRLEKQGITLQLLRNIYFSFFRFDLNEYLTSMTYRCKNYLEHKYPSMSDKRRDEKVNRMSDLLLIRHFTILNEEDEFQKVLGNFVCTGTYEDYLERMSKALREKIETRDPQTTDFQEKQSIDWLFFYKNFLKEFLSEDPYLRTTSEEVYSSSGSVDIDILFSVAMSIYASSPDTPIEFNFTDFTDSETEISSEEISLILSDLRHTLFARASVMYAAFGKASHDPPLSKVLATANVQVFQSTKEKGDVLEGLVAKIFSSEPGFIVRENVRRSGEEIDLVIKNKIDDPFWSALQSPIILVECKHHKTRIEPKDLRNFEIKIMDRKNLCRLGIIVSVSGFTRGCIEAAARSSRDGHRIILVDGKMLEQRINDYTSTAHWLEDLIVDQL